MFPYPTLRQTSVFGWLIRRQGSAHLVRWACEIVIPITILLPSSGYGVSQHNIQAEFGPVEVAGKFAEAGSELLW
jgi:hypothetical protein